MDCVVGIGGGSVIDAAKAIAAMTTNEGDVIDYLEVIGRGRPLEKPALPCVAIPTTAGTGSEVTRNSVLASRAHGVKVSLRGPSLLPRLAIVDPSLTLELPPALTATTGLDALTQLIEAYVSCRANPMTDALCQEGIGRAATALRRAFHDGTDSGGPRGHGAGESLERHGAHERRPRRRPRFRRPDRRRVRRAARRDLRVAPAARRSRQTFARLKHARRVTRPVNGSLASRASSPAIPMRRLPTASSGSPMSSRNSGFRASGTTASAPSTSQAWSRKRRAPAA